MAPQARLQAQGRRVEGARVLASQADAFAAARSTLLWDRLISQDLPAGHGSQGLSVLCCVNGRQPTPQPGLDVARSITWMGSKPAHLGDLSMRRKPVDDAAHTPAVALEAGARKKGLPPRHVGGIVPQLQRHVITPSASAGT